MISWINKNKESIIRAAFLVPILSVAIISISHVVKWYDLGNPISWAIYLSIAIEVAALSSIAASSVRVKGFSVWLVFIIVTLVQFIGNIYFSYTEIDVTSKAFKDWAELTLPVFEAFSDTSDLISQRRLLALLEGGLLPIISLTCLHFFIKYGDRDFEQPAVYTEEDNAQDSQEKIEESEKSHLQKEADRVWEKVAELKEKGIFTEPTEEEKKDEPTALANSKYRLEETDDLPPIDETVQFTPSQEDNLEKKTPTNVKSGVSLTKLPLSNINKLRRQ
jgi:hypothetical protein